jgi:hypothetical protein
MAGLFYFPRISQRVQFAAASYRAGVTFTATWAYGGRAALTKNGAVKSNVQTGYAPTLRHKGCSAAPQLSSILRLVPMSEDGSNERGRLQWI